MVFVVSTHMSVTDPLKAAARRFFVLAPGMQSLFLTPAIVVFAWLPLFALGILRNPRANSAFMDCRESSVGVEGRRPKEDLVTVLARSSFRKDEAAFFSWLGVTIYLTREANLATLRAVATCGAQGS